MSLGNALAHGPNVRTNQQDPESGRPQHFFYRVRLQSATLYRYRALQLLLHGANRRTTAGDLVVFFQGQCVPPANLCPRPFLEVSVSSRKTSFRTTFFRPESGRPKGPCHPNPHPWLMPDFWPIPATVSHGFLGPIQAYLQARLQ